MTLNINDILSELSRAKEALDALPDARRKIDDLEFDNSRKQHTIDDTTANLNSAQAKIEELFMKLRQVEEERDQYGFRAMEADEKLEKVLALVRPQPVQAGTEVKQPEDAQADAQANADQPQPSGSGETALEKAWNSSDNEADVSQGQSVEHPTFQSGASTTNASSTSVHSEGSEQIAPASSGPYAGRKYYDKPENVTWHDWDQGGGELAPWMS